jgi:hypothetical protein
MPTSVKVKNEPPSPPKKAIKRGFEEVIRALESEDDQDITEVVPSSSKTRLASIDIPSVRRSARKSTKSSKKARYDLDPMDELHDALKTQFRIIGDAFQAVSEAFEAFAKRDE